MTTISPHTTRASGTILTASIYNADHANHVTNAQNLNEDKLETAAASSVDGDAVVFDGTSGEVIRSAGFAPANDEEVLKLDESEVLKTEDVATDSEVRASTEDKSLHAGHLASAAAAAGALSDDATITVDWDAFIFDTLEITDDRTLGNPSNGNPGEWRYFYLTSDAGPDTLSFDDEYVGPAVDSPPAPENGVTAYVVAILCVTASLFVVTALEVDLS